MRRPRELTAFDKRLDQITQDAVKHTVAKIEAAIAELVASRPPAEPPEPLPLGDDVVEVVARAWRQKRREQGYVVGSWDGMADLEKSQYMAAGRAALTAFAAMRAALEVGARHDERAALSASRATDRGDTPHAPLPPAPTSSSDKLGAWSDVLAERQRQVEVEGWTPEHDDQHRDGEIARAAAAYAWMGMLPEWRAADIVELIKEHGMGAGQGGLLEDLWPWNPVWLKAHGQRRSLVKAGALILAEIERLDRAAAPLNPAPDPADLRGEP